MAFRYPYENDLHIKSKYAVSELKQANAENEAAVTQKCATSGEEHSAAMKKEAARGKGFCSKDTRGKTDMAAEITLAEPASFHARSGFTAAQIGTITHKVLEKLDFRAAQRAAEVLEGQAAAVPQTEAAQATAVSNAEESQDALAVSAETQNAAAEAAPAPQTEAGERVLPGKQAGIAYVQNLLARMVTEEFLTAEEAAVADAEKIAAFARSPLGRRIAASQNVRREQPFNILLEVNGSMAAVQGIIDCCFEEDGAWVLLDYKTTRVENAAELAHRAPQLRKTYAAQMEIYRRALETGDRHAGARNLSLFDKPWRNHSHVRFRHGRSLSFSI